MVADYCLALWLWGRFGEYEPFRVTPRSAFRWLNQFSDPEKRAIAKAVRYLSYVSEHRFVKNLIDRNRALLSKLKQGKVPLTNVIYVSIGEAGSSSHSILNLVRDRAGLQNLGCRFTDGKSYDALSKLTNQLGAGAIVYVDDFAGTGEQFCEEQEQLASYIIGNFSQYYLLHTVCEEALYKIDGNGVTPWQHSIHAKVDRPLHEDSTILTTHERRILRDLCVKIGDGKRDSLGHGSVAASVVFYRNTPDNVPRIFRGGRQQKHYLGLVPRTTDLPKPSIE